MKPPRFIVRATKRALNALAGQSRTIHPLPTSMCKKLADTELVLAAGMPRSASTWLYNAARLLLCSSSETAGDFSCGWVGDIGTIPKKRFMLIKLHEFDPGLVNVSNTILYSTRDIKDALASTQRKFGHTPSPERADAFAQQCEKWTEVAEYVMRYEAMIASKTKILADMAQVLGIQSYDSRAILQDLEQLSYENDGPKNQVYHEVNLFHPGHRTTGVREPSSQMTL